MARHHGRLTSAGHSAPARAPLNKGERATGRVPSVLALSLREMQTRHVLVRAGLFGRGADASEVAGTSAVVAEDLDAGLIVGIEQIGYVATDRVSALVAIGQCCHLGIC